VIQGTEERLAKRDTTVVPFEGRVKPRPSDSAAQPPPLQQSHFSARVRAQMAVASSAISSLDEEYGTGLREVSEEAARLDLQQAILHKCSEIAFLLQLFIDERRRVSAASEGTPPGGRTPQDGTTTASASSANSISLSYRERGILELIGHGYSNKEIARKIGIGAETVKSTVKRIFIKLNAGRRAQAVLRAQTLGLLGCS
jgi:LuxR family transcriptional regulator, maltose regulon positive regulatory protein